MARRSDHSRSTLTRMILESAREIVVRDGIGGLSGRKVTKKVGYTIGTLYQLFNDMDDLVERLNAETLSLLYDHCSQDALSDNVASQLKTLSVRFIEFVSAHPKEWDAVMSYRYKPDHTTSDQYAYEINRLFGLMSAATQHFYSNEDATSQAADMALLWASLTGLWGVASSEREVGGPLEEMIDRLIDMYLQARTNKLPS